MDYSRATIFEHGLLFLLVYELALLPLTLAPLPLRRSRLWRKDRYLLSRCRFFNTGSLDRIGIGEIKCIKVPWAIVVHQQDKLGGVAGYGIRNGCAVSQDLAGEEDVLESGLRRLEITATDLSF